MIRLNNDYNHGACEEILQALQQTNACHYGGYGYDEWCEKGAAAIKEHLGMSDVDIHFMIGGTQTNYTVIDAALRPYQSVICADTGHINCHEAGSIERTGHKILVAPAQDGKITAAAIRQLAKKYRSSGEAEYLTQPKLVFLSSPSEYGTIYNKAELREIKDVCCEYGLYLYVDGARLAYWLTAEGCDVTMRDLGELTDAFYIGGTKCGALLGEALVVINRELRPHFRTLMKQTGGILAKGWLLGLQFYTLLENDLYFSLARHANEQALRLRSAFIKAGIKPFMESCTNQQFVVLTPKQAEALSKVCIYELDHELPNGQLCVRFCTSWSTTDEEIAEMERYVLALRKVKA